MSLPTPWEQDWPGAGLQTLSRCPLCGHRERSLWHCGLRDETFRVAAGRWDLWRCSSCHCAYLDPRPSEATVLDAYGCYYTHEPPKTQASGASNVPGGWRDRLANGYCRARFGAPRRPASSWGVWVFRALPIRRSALDREFRHLPRLPAQGGRLLDVGCGNGTFLGVAAACGWHVTGLEPDPMAAAQAAGCGHEVQVAGLDALDDLEAQYDVITMSHVIEHLHDPARALVQCHRLLRPGGRLWLETPNAESIGHQRFGRHWRGLEAPRHLVLFAATGLSRLLRRAGFTSVQSLPVPSSRTPMFEQSRALAQLDAAMPLLPEVWRRVGIEHWAERMLGAPREFLTVAAHKSR